MRDEIRCVVVDYGTKRRALEAEGGEATVVVVEVVVKIEYTICSIRYLFIYSIVLLCFYGVFYWCGDVL